MLPIPFAMCDVKNQFLIFEQTSIEKCVWRYALYFHIGCHQTQSAQIGVVCVILNLMESLDFFRVGITKLLSL